MKKVIGRAYSADEKKAIVDRIYEAWCQAPDLRLGQFLLVSSGKRDLFYVEDEDLMKGAERMGLLAADAIAHRHVEANRIESEADREKPSSSSSHVVRTTPSGDAGAYASRPNDAQ